MKRLLEELLFAVEMNKENRLNAGGLVSYPYAHAHRIVHTTVLIVLMLCPMMKIILMQRPHTKRLYPGAFDILGGHVTADMRAINNPDLLQQVIDCAALREASEEARLTKDGEPLLVDDLALVRFTDYGELYAESELNMELSTGYCLFVPEDVRVSCADEGDHGRHEKLNQRALTLDDLKADYAKSPQNYADGAGRLLKRLLDSTDPVTRRFKECIAANA